MPEPQTQSPRHLEASGTPCESNFYNPNIHSTGQLIDAYSFYEPTHRRLIFGRPNLLRQSYDLRRAQTPLRRNVKRFRSGLVLKAHRFVYHSPIGSRAIKKKKKQAPGRERRSCRINMAHIRQSRLNFSQDHVLAFA